MSKLFKLKEWVTPQEAADHLSKVLAEPIHEADIFRLALDKHLVMSVNLVNGAVARLGEYIDDEEVDFIKYELDPATGEKLDPPYIVPPPNYLNIDVNKWLRLNTNVNFISGVWDLTLIGAEAIDMEDYYQSLTSGLKVNLMGLDGVFLSQGKLIAQPQTDFEDNEFQLGSIAHLKALKKNIIKNNLTDEQATEEIKKFDSERKIFLKERDHNKKETRYYPSPSVSGHDCMFVVKTSEISRFLQSLEEVPPQSKPMNTKERNSLLVLIGALCKQLKIDPNERGVSTSIVHMTELIGARLCEDTIRKILKQVEPAISSKSK